MSIKMQQQIIRLERVIEELQDNIMEIHEKLKKLDSHDTLIEKFLKEPSNAGRQRNQRNSKQ